jgi:hypothetical protein
MYKVKNNLCPGYISGILNLNVSSLSTLGIFPRPCTYGKHSIRYIGPVIWSKLNRDIKNSETISLFKRQVRKVDIEYLISEKCKNCYLCNT